MSNRLTIARDALRELLHASREGLPLDLAWKRAERALEVTGFASPPAFPCVVETRAGKSVTLVARHGDQLVGVAVLHDDGECSMLWNGNGSLFSMDDPSEHDLVMPEAAPIGRVTT